MSFVMVGGDATKKVQYLDPDGRETYQHDDPYLFVRYEAAGALPSSKRPKLEASERNEDTDKPAEEDESEDDKPDPQLAINSISAAQQELTVLIDLIDSVASLSTVDVQYVDNGRSQLDTFREIALSVESRKDTLDKAAKRLRGASAQLREQVAQDNMFVRELAELQAFWRIIPTTEGSSTGFYVMLAFPLSIAPTHTGGTGGVSPPKLPFEHIRLSQGLTGSVITSVPSKQSIPTVLGSGTGSAQPLPDATVSVGAQQVHHFLKQRFAELVWTAVAERCSWEISQAPHALFTRNIVSRALEQLQRGGHGSVRLLRPLLEHLMLINLIPGPLASSRLRLTPLLLSSLKELHLGKQVRCVLLEQVRCYPGATMVTIADGGASVVACRLQAEGLGSLLVMYYDQGLSHDRIAVCSLPRADSPLHTSSTLAEYRLPAVSLHELEQLLPRLWGAPT